MHMQSASICLIGLALLIWGDVLKDGGATGTILNKKREAMKCAILTDLTLHRKSQLDWRYHLCMCDLNVISNTPY